MTRLQLLAHCASWKVRRIAWILLLPKSEPPSPIACSFLSDAGELVKLLLEGGANRSAIPGLSWVSPALDRDGLGAGGAGVARGIDFPRIRMPLRRASCGGRDRKRADRFSSARQ